MNDAWLGIAFVVQAALVAAAVSTGSPVPVWALLPVSAWVVLLGRRERARRLEVSRVANAAAAAARAERLRLEAILEHLPVGVVMVDVDGDAPWPINPAGRALLTGDGKRNAARSAFVLERADGEPITIEDNPLRQAIERREAVCGEQLRLRRESGEVVELEVAAAPVLSADGVLLGAVAVFEDRTRVNESRRALEGLLAERNEFLASVSHALRTPLTVVTGFADLLWEGSYGTIDPALRHPLGRLRANAAHLLELVNGLLDLARLRSGKLSLEPEVFELAPILWDAAAAVRRAACDRIEVEVECACDGEPLRVRADRLRLGQALRQLCAGAIELEPRGTLTIRAHRFRREGRPFAEIEVRDAGGALDADLLTLVLSKDDRLAELDPEDSGITEQVKIDQSGLRVGVRTAAGLIRLMGGRLGVERRSEGGRLFVHLPLVNGCVLAGTRERSLELSHVG